MHIVPTTYSSKGVSPTPTTMLNMTKLRKNQKLESLVLNRLAEDQILKTQVALTSRANNNDS